MSNRVYQYALEIANQAAAPVSSGSLHQMTINAVFPQAAFQNISGQIGGNEIATYARSLDRLGKLCAPGQTANLILDPSFPYTVQPGQAVVLYEFGVKVLTGYVVKVTRSRPSHDWEVEVVDTFTRLANFFIDTQEITTAGHDTAYWIGNICNRVGIAYHISTNDQTFPVPPGIQIGMRTANDALLDIITYSSQYMYPDPDGVLQVGRVVSSRRRVLREIIEAHDTTSDEQTRTVIKVYGGGGTNPNRVFAEFNVNTTGINVDLTAAVGAPMVQTQAEADRVANYMGWQLSPVTRHDTVKIQSNPLITVGSVVAITYSHSGHDYSWGGPVTTMNSRLDENGYYSEVTIGERCPRIAGWSNYIPPVFAGTIGNGVYRSDNRGVDWYDYNGGLPQGMRPISRIAANFKEQVMAIMSNKLYYNGGGTWAEVTLPAPTNTAGDSPAPTIRQLRAVDAVGSGPFAVLAVGFSGTGFISTPRTWVYEATTGSGDANTSSPLEWTSTEMVYVDITSGSTTYNIFGYDLSSRNGSIYVLANSGSFGVYVPPVDCNGFVIPGTISGNESGTITSHGVVKGVTDYSVVWSVNTAVLDHGFSIDSNSFSIALNVTWTVTVTAAVPTGITCRVAGYASNTSSGLTYSTATQTYDASKFAAPFFGTQTITPGAAGTYTQTFQTIASANASAPFPGTAPYQNAISPCFLNCCFYIGGSLWGESTSSDTIMAVAGGSPVVLQPFSDDHGFVTDAHALILTGAFCS